MAQYVFFHPGSLFHEVYLRENVVFLPESEVFRDARLHGVLYLNENVSNPLNPSNPFPSFQLWKDVSYPLNRVRPSSQSVTDVLNPLSLVSLDRCVLIWMDALCLFHLAHCVRCVYPDPHLSPLSCGRPWTAIGVFDHAI